MYYTTKQPGPGDEHNVAQCSTKNDYGGNCVSYFLFPLLFDKNFCVFFKPFFLDFIKQNLGPVKEHIRHSSL